MTESDAVDLPVTVNPDDPHRPAYHFLPEANWLNDPNGLIQWQGRYHLFYQCNPNGPFHGTVHWGHAVSEDLVHWEHLPIALTPTPNSPDQDGCFSGCAVDNNGVATLIYTGVRGPELEDELACVATSTDELLITWEKYPGNPVIAAPPPDLKLVAYRDHSVWKEDDTWYQVIGAGIQDVGGTALLYRSPDLLTWQYLQPILVGDRTETAPIVTGDMWECPALFSLDNKHVLMISVWANHTLINSSYFVGEYKQQLFTPEHRAIVDNGGSFYAPQTMLDNQGRRLMWGWLREQRSLEAQRLAGWSGTMTLPRQLSVLPDGRLTQTPVPELQQLRTNHQQFQQLVISPDAGLALPEIQGDCLEIIITLEADQSENVGLAVRCSPDGVEQTLILYDWSSSELIIDLKDSSLTPDVSHERYTIPCHLDSPGNIKLHIFLDRSVIEVFANDQTAMASRIYPTRPDSLGVRLVANGGQATARSMDVWTISPITSTPVKE